MQPSRTSLTRNWWGFCRSPATFMHRMAAANCAMTVSVPQVMSPAACLVIIVAAALMAPAVGIGPSPAAAAAAGPCRAQARRLRSQLEEKPAACQVSDATFRAALRKIRECPRSKPFTCSYNCEQGLLAVRPTRTPRGPKNPSVPLPHTAWHCGSCCGANVQKRIM